MRSALPLLAVILLATAALQDGPPAGVGAPPPAAVPGAAPALLVVPHLPLAVRERLLVSGQVLVDNPDPAGRVATVTGLSIERADRPGAPLFAIDLARPLVGDDTFATIGALRERLPHELSGHRRDTTPVFGPADAVPLQGEAAREAWLTAVNLTEALSQRLQTGAPASFTRIDVPLPLWLVFDAGELPGAERELRLRVDWIDADGVPASTTVARTFRLLVPWGAAPPSFAAALPGVSVHSGDLHVHSCHGEALGACSPSSNCTAESLQVSGAFSYAQLKSQYQALGLDWFTATDHSYCINSGSEYAAIVAECAAVTDGGFACFPDTELSSEEVGAQTGSDSGDLLCLLGPESNHMGAHGISSRKPGGDEGLLGFCNGLFSDALEPFTDNVAAVRADGGWPVVNHPTDDSFAWNSFAATKGIEKGKLHGVEIWNGSTPANTPGHVSRWVSWLLAGRVLYAYSGSDTHDEAFAFGANRALLLPGQALTRENVTAALRAGRNTVSDGPFLALEVVHDGKALLQGALQSLAPTQPPATLELQAHYDFGTASGTVTIRKGRVGDGAETIVCQSGTLSGAGVFTCSDALELGVQSWYRVKALTTGGAQAFTNPVFFLPGGCAHVAYGQGLPAPHIGSLTSGDSPAIGSLNTLAIAGFPNSTVVWLLVGLAPEFGGIPFKGGQLLVSVPLALQIPLPLSDGARDVQLALPDDPALVGASLAWQAVAADATQPKGFAFSNGLLTTICSPFP